jgi:hypothetical protein
MGANRCSRAARLSDLPTLPPASAPDRRSTSLACQDQAEVSLAASSARVDPSCGATLFQPPLWPAAPPHPERGFRTGLITIRITPIAFFTAPPSVAVTGCGPRAASSPASRLAIRSPTRGRMVAPFILACAQACLNHGTLPWLSWIRNVRAAADSAFLVQVLHLRPWNLTALAGWGDEANCEPSGPQHAQLRALPN